MAKIAPAMLLPLIAKQTLPQFFHFISTLLLIFAFLSHEYCYGCHQMFWMTDNSSVATLL